VQPWYSAFSTSRREVFGAKTKKEKKKNTTAGHNNCEAWIFDFFLAGYLLKPNPTNGLYSTELKEAKRRGREKQKEQRSV
jgi:hypothetical protein